MSNAYSLQRFAASAFFLALLAFVIQGCEPVNKGARLPNQIPLASLANVPPTDPAEDTTGNDGLWNMSTDDLGRDGLSDQNETGCRGAYDPVTNPDPAYDNYDPASADSCSPGYPMKANAAAYTQNNGRPDAGEPHVTRLRPSKSPLVKLHWVGNDGDGFVTAFMYRWSFKNKIGDTVVQHRPWSTVLNYVTNDNDHLILLLNVAEGQEAVAAPEVFKYFANTDLDPDKRNPKSPSYDSNLVNIYEGLATGKTVNVKGYRVFASNPRGVLYPVHESPNSGTFIFESDDFLNRHAFEVRAIDNEGAIGPSTEVRFWTPKVEPPRVQFIYDLVNGEPTCPTPGDTLFVLNKRTFTWPGILFTFKGSDRNSRTLEFSWKVDTRPWSPFTPLTVAYPTAADMDTPYTGRHVFYVRAKNEFGTITPEDSLPSWSFVTIYPNFAIEGTPKRALLVGLNRTQNGTRGRPTEAQIMGFYTSILGDSIHMPFDLHLVRALGAPSFEELSNYTVAYLVTDVEPPGGNASIIDPDVFIAYVRAGGNMMYNSFNSRIIVQLFLQSYVELFRDRFQLRDLGEGQITYKLNDKFDFLGAEGDPRLGYPDCDLDTSKCDTAWHDAAFSQIGLRFVSICQPQGFAERIYKFKAVGVPHFDEFGAPISFNGQGMGVRYIGATYQTIWFGFPMYFVHGSQAAAALRKGLRDLHQLD